MVAHNTKGEGHMASALQQLRKAAGYKSAKEFGAQMGIPLATYARYESNPEKIPLQAAWSLANKLGCSIDVIVGRARLDANQGSEGGMMQAAYDSLSPQLKQSLDNYLAYLVTRNADEQRRRAAAQQRRYDIISSRLEQVFLAGLDAKSSDITVFSPPAQVRQAFQAYVEQRAARRCEPEVAGSIDQIMAAYDRAHGSFEADCATIDFCEADTPAPDIEYAMVPLGCGQEGGAGKEQE